MDVKIKATQVNCVAPGNIHTPTMEGIRNCEGLKGWGRGEWVQRPKKFQRGVEFDGRFGFQMVNQMVSKILSYLLNKFELEYLYLNHIIFKMNFLSSESTLEANKCKEHAVTRKWLPLLVTGLRWSHQVDQKASGD